MSFTVPAELATSIGRVADRLRVTRSGLLALLLEEPITELAKLVDLLPADGNPGDVKRLRGASVKMLTDAVSSAMKVALELDPNAKLDL